MAKLKKVKQQLADIGTDLFNLEINTILKKNINANKMPSPRHALIDIGKTYSRKLIAWGLEAELGETGHPGSQARFAKIKTVATTYRAKLAAKTGEPDQATQEAMVLLDRIVSKCGRILGMMKAWQQRNLIGWDNDFSRDDVDARAELDLETKERVLLRKIWELGTEEVVMQTVVQLDGDVVTRINPNFTDQRYQGLQAVHHQGTQISMKMWRELVSVLMQFVEKGLKLLKPG